MEGDVILDMKLLYIHGYGSNGNATKAQKLQAMFPEDTVISPTFDYDRLAPQEIYRQLQQLVAQEQPALILGSSTGGYYALCCAQFYRGPIWCVNPVRDIIVTIQRHLAVPTTGQNDNIAARLKAYELFDQSVFRQLEPLDGQLHLALSTDDELLGDHRPLLDLFPNHGPVIWKDRCGHRFYRFDELQVPLAESLTSGK